MKAKPVSLEFVQFINVMDLVDFYNALKSICNNKLNLHW